MLQKHFPGLNASSRLWLSAVAVAMVLCLFLAAMFSRPSPITDRILLATANELMRNKVSLPHYLTGTVPGAGERGSYAGSICFGILSGPPLTTDPNTWVNAILTVDNKRIAVSPSSQLSSLMLLEGRDEQGHIVQWGGPIETCYELRLAAGVHLATIEVWSWSGQLYSYSWAFEITFFAKSLAK